MTIKASLNSVLAGGVLLACSAGLVGCGAGPAAGGPNDTLRAYSAALDQGRVDDAYSLLSTDAKRTISLEAFRRAIEENPNEVREISAAIARPTSAPVVTATVVVPSGEELLLIYEDGRWKIDGAAVDLYGQATPRQALVGFLRAFDRKRYDVVLRFVPDAEKEAMGGAPAGSSDGGSSDGGSTDGGSPDGGPTDGGPTDGGAGVAEPGGSGASSPASPGQGVRLTAEKLKAAWEGPQKDQMNRIVQAIKAALPNATIEETGDQASMSYGANGTVSFRRENGVWKIRNF